MGPYLSAAVAACALGFTVAAFWWLNARRGTIEAAEPGAYAYGSPPSMLRLPLVLYNNGARALVVADMRLVIETEAGRDPLGWITTRNQLKPARDDGHRFATPFAIPGRSAYEVIAEFGDEQHWRPPPRSRQRLRLDARVHPSRNWTTVETFDWWPPPADAATGHHIAYRNAPAD